MEDQDLLLEDKTQLTADSDARTKEIYKVTLWGSVVNCVLTAFKFIAGTLGHSSAMIADAVHSLSDLVTDVIVIAFVRISGKPEDADHKYGHGKYETLATAIIGIILFIVGIGVLIHSVETIYAFFQGKPLQAPGMLALVAAVVSIVLKEGVYRYTYYKGKKLCSKAVIANAWHHRSDALSSLGTLAGIAGAMFLGASWRVLDPVAALVVSFFIMKVAYSLVKPCVDELLEKSLPRETEDEIFDIIKSFDEVSEPHHLRTRRIGNDIAIEVHIRMNPEMPLREAHDTTKRIESALKAKYGPHTHIGIHMEPIKSPKE